MNDGPLTMWPYLLMFLIPASLALTESTRVIAGRRRLAWSIVAVILTVLIGCRFQVGGDWETYLYMFNRSSQSDFVDYLSEGDASYQLVNWISNRLGWDIFGVNLITGAIFSYGLVSFCRAQLRPWLALAVAVPYLVIVVGMGYSRQAAALGLEMLALNALAGRRVTKFVLLVIAAASFHKTAVVILVFLILVAETRKHLLIYLVSLAIFGVVIFNHVLTAADIYSRAYLDTSYESQGAAIRLTLNFVPSVVTLIARRTIGFDRFEGRLWVCFSILSIVCLVALFISPSSTAIDRIALYLLPLQIVVFSRLPLLVAPAMQWGRLGPRPHPFTIVTTAIVLMSYGMVEIVWLTGAQTAFAWLPYRSYLLEKIT